MRIESPPRPYPEWREDGFERELDAAHTFGYHLFARCRDEAIATLPADAAPEVKAKVERAVDAALAQVTAMLEGIWSLESGPKHSVDLALLVRVRDADGNVIESQEISPLKLDLQVHFFSWLEGVFRSGTSR
jgi:hypothetical protein